MTIATQIDHASRLAMLLIFLALFLLGVRYAPDISASLSEKLERASKIQVTTAQ